MRESRASRRTAMTTEQQIRNVIDRCLSIMASEHERRRRGERSERFTYEIRLLACFVDEMNLGVGEDRERILLPASRELAGRHDDEAGARLLADFLDEFSWRGDISPKI